MVDTDHGLRADRSNWREVASRLAPAWLNELRGAAKAIGGGLMDGDDLLGEAIEGLLQAWARGAGPDAGFHGYLVRSMRNRLVDEARSPRSRSVPYEEGVIAEEVGAKSTIEAHVERLDDRGLMERAMRTLPDDYADVLIETCVHGRKPAELAAEWGVSANTVAQRALRARQRLKNSYLAELAPPANRHTDH